MKDLFKSRRVKNLFWFGIATMIFLVLLWRADPGKVLSAIQQAKFSYLLLSLVTGLLVIVTWSANWYNFFQSLDIKCSFPRTFQLFSAGQFLNCITPLGRFGGQPFMAYLISKNSDTSYEKSLATVMSADLISLFPFSGFVLLGYLYLILTGNLKGHLVAMSGVIAVVLLFGVSMSYIGWYRSGSMERFFLRVFTKITEVTGHGSRYVEKLEERLKGSEETLNRIGKSPRTLLLALLISSVAFILKMIAFYFVLMALGVQMRFLFIMLIVPLISLANISPTPGGSGAFEGAMTATIVLLIDVTLATALTITILYRVSTYWLALVVGYLSTTSLDKTPDT